MTQLLLNAWRVFCEVWCADTQIDPRGGDEQ